MIIVILLSISLIIAKLSELSTISGYSFNQVFTPVGVVFNRDSSLSNTSSEKASLDLVSSLVISKVIFSSWALYLFLKFSKVYFTLRIKFCEAFLSIATSK